MKLRLAVPALLAATLALGLGVPMLHAADNGQAAPQNKEASSQPATTTAPATNATTGTIKGKVSTTGDYAVNVMPIDQHGGKKYNGTVAGDGSFEVKDVAPGRYTIMIFDNAQHRPVAVYPNHTVTAGQTLDLTKAHNAMGGPPQMNH